MNYWVMVFFGIFDGLVGVCGQSNEKNESDSDPVTQRKSDK